jgi:hypothetical protein
VAGAYTFRESIKAISPSWFQSGVAEKFVYSIGILLDDLSEGVRQGVMSRMPGHCPSDALPAIGNDRQLVRGFQEPDATFAARLSAAFSAWQKAGVPDELMNQLAAYVAPTTLQFRTVSQSAVNTSTTTWFQRSTAGALTYIRWSPGNWNWDGQTKWWRSWVIIYGGSLFNAGRSWTDGWTWGDGRTWGSNATAAQVSTIQALVKQWKPAHTQVINIIVVFDNALFDMNKPPGDASLPDGNFGTWSKQSAGVQVPARFANAAYWDGVV